jgi:hypothetical protein
VIMASIEPSGATLGPAVVVVGCSEELPNDLRAYHLVSASADGVAALTRHDGTDYTGTLNQFSYYRAAMAGMVKSVVRHVPMHLRSRARVSLLKRWNHDWDFTLLCGSCAICARESQGYPH